MTYGEFVGQKFEKRGFKKGYSEGFKIGYREGFRIGYREGIKMREEEGKGEVARNLLLKLNLISHN